jgi:hypothetical protein
VLGVTLVFLSTILYIRVNVNIIELTLNNNFSRRNPKPWDFFPTAWDFSPTAWDFSPTVWKLTGIPVMAAIRPDDHENKCHA